MLYSFYNICNITITYTQTHTHTHTHTRARARARVYASIHEYFNYFFT